MIDGQSFIKTLDAAIEALHTDEHRPYIGASSIGNPCSRAIWYGYKGHQGKPFEAKLLRTFEIGKRLEGMIINFILKAGFTVEMPTESNNWLACEDKDYTVFRGHMDGILYLNENQPVVLEIKTAKQEEYKKFVEHGLKQWKPVYHAQCQSYMGMDGLKYTIFIVLNKNTSEWHAELITFDEIHYDELRAKSRMIAESEDPPERINKNPCYWVCQMCPYKEPCHNP